jgi:1,2-diacylglycerol 3-alpha-glucosyltransferase
MKKVIIMQNLKILIVEDQYFSANNGMTISSRRFASVLREHGHEVRIVSTGKPGDTPYLMPDYHMPVFDGLITSQGMVFAKTDDRILREAIEWADIIHFMAPFALSHNGILIARSLGKPVTAGFHVQPENISYSIHLGRSKLVNDGIYRWFWDYIYKYIPHIHCPSNYIAQELRKHGYTSKLHVISNGIDPDFKYFKSEKPPRYKDRFVILTTGRYSFEKGQLTLFRAVSRSGYRDRISVIAAGQGPLRSIYEKAAKQFGIDVTFNFYKKEDLIKIISFSDLYVHAAVAEIEAMACMEAFAGGLVPVISDSPKSATSQFALDERSLFASGNSSDLAKKIDFWIDHEDERKKMELVYANFAGNYKLENCVIKAEDMFREAIDDRKKQPQ